MRKLCLIISFLLSACGQSAVKNTAITCLTSLPEPVNIQDTQGKVGSDTAYPEERPVRHVSLEPFNMDTTEVTNAQFAAFVKETGYVSDAEKIQPGFDKAGAAVFIPPTPQNPSWWQFVEGANWQHPEGPESSIRNRDNDPVVQVSYNDAKAYAAWAGRRLPSSEEWEIAAKAGSDTDYVWGDEFTPNDQPQANTWQGAFPIQNTKVDGYGLRSPVGCYAPNNYGLYDMIGNVWEWTDTIYQETKDEPIYTLKGGSFLCAPNYCKRYRASALQPQEAGLPTNHIGFRTVSSE